MTYKYTNFKDSHTMRSLEKIAIDKGWVEKKQLVKKASGPEKISISENIDENLSNLIVGLKKAGLNDLAAEVQSKFLNYKKAEADLYDSGHQDPNDLVHKAHPGKSPNVGKNDLSLIESIYEQHEKMMKFVDSKKKVKIASSKDFIINECVNFYNTKLNSRINKIYSLIDSSSSEDDFETGKNKKSKQNISSLFINFRNSILNMNKNTDSTASSINNIIPIFQTLDQDLQFNLRPINKEIYLEIKTDISSFIVFLSNYSKRITKKQNEVEQTKEYLPPEPEEFLPPKPKENNSDLSKIQEAKSLASELQQMLNQYENEGEDIADLKSWLFSKNSLIARINMNYNNFGKIEGIDAIIADLKSAKQKWSSQ